MVGMPENAALSVGDLVELDLTGIAHGGVGVARHEGRVVFVADAIPGERVRARITEARKKSFARAATVEVLDPSEDRRPHIWPEAGLERDPAERPGGAEFGHIALPRQRALKAEVLTDALRRFGGLGTDALRDLGGGVLQVESLPGDAEAEAPGLDGTTHTSAPGLGYRTRVRLHVDPETGEVGPYAARSRRVIRTASLPLAVEEIGWIAPLDEAISEAEAVDLVSPSADDPRMLVSYPGERRRAGADDPVRESVGGREFLVRAGGFWQVHREAPVTLFEAVRDAILELAGSDRFDPGAANLDLYGGAGLLAAAVAEAAGPGLRITTVESDPGATDDAAENLADLVGALTVTARVDRHLAELRAAAAPVRERLRRGTVVLDPPRSGAGGEVCAGLGEVAPANIVYVACDPVALARDTATLRELGYTPVSLRALDLFPHTHHFETLAVFLRD
ncbi:class I SAM-dependent RNA methyltransferase [Leucobacter weissii]|uniref:Class I SAM-dependent RNA methyltransferase n=1 Tax=Leucobacter weissii TaxID=1983706 RepID=A0A939MKJ1_9MICO|nr:TRAM domain-containing protein [Leucobacter weissii]MBO1902669.1 class I SAM-dependent RNA methyltransferase [Leucobacter weissii]